MDDFKKEITGIIGNALIDAGSKIPGDIADKILSLIAKTDGGAEGPCNDGLSNIILDWEKAADVREETANKEKGLYRTGMGDGMARAYRSCADRLRRLMEEDGR